MPVRAGIQTTRKQVLNNQGFTLVEVGVAMAVGAVLILALTQYTLTTARSQKSQDLSNEFSQVMGTVGQALSSESICTSMLGNINNTRNNIYVPSPMVSGAPVPSGSPVPLAISVTGQNPQTILTTGSLPSGLNIVSIIAEAPTVMGPPSASGFTPEMLPITITAMKGPQPSPSPSNGNPLNRYFIGNNYFTKTFTVSVWVSTTTGAIYKCTSSQDMAQQAPATIPSPFPSIGLTCIGPPPTCPSGLATAYCCQPSSAPMPFWACQTNGWSCS